MRDINTYEKLKKKVSMCYHTAQLEKISVGLHPVDILHQCDQDNYHQDSCPHRHL